MGSYLVKCNLTGQSIQEGTEVQIAAITDNLNPNVLSYNTNALIYFGDGDHWRHLSLPVVNGKMDDCGLVEPHYDEENINNLKRIIAFVLLNSVTPNKSLYLQTDETLKQSISVLKNADEINESNYYEVMTALRNRYLYVTSGSSHPTKMSFSVNTTSAVTKLREMYNSKEFYTLNDLNILGDDQELEDRIFTIATPYFQIKDTDATKRFIDFDELYDELYEAVGIFRSNETGLLLRTVMSCLPENRRKSIRQLIHLSRRTQIFEFLNIAPTPMAYANQDYGNYIGQITNIISKHVHDEMEKDYE